MTSLYKQKIQLIPKKFNLLSFLVLLLLISFYLFSLNLSFLSPQEKGWEEINNPTLVSSNVEISFEQIAFSPPLKESVISETVGPEIYQEEPLEEIFEKEDIITPSPQTKESSKEGAPALSPKQEKKIVDEIAYELSRTFNSVKYYSSESKKEKLEGESILLVRISEKGDIIEVKRQDNLQGSLSHDLNYSIEKLKKNWRGKNKTKKEITLQMKVTYKLI